jgi:hypothetical protein
MSDLKKIVSLIRESMYFFLPDLPVLSGGAGGDSSFLSEKTGSG